LDRVKILFQASNPQFAKYTGSWFGVVTAMRDINQQDGLRGLFRGHSATLLRIFPYAAIKFLAYEQFRSIIIKDKSQETPFRRLISGSLAGVTSVFFTYPLEVIRVRLAFETRRDHRSTLSSICKQIYNEQPPAPSHNLSSAANTVASSAAGTTPLPIRAAASTIATTVSTLESTRSSSGGLANFYRGFSPTLWGMLPYAGMSFLTHDTVGDWLRHPSISRYTTLPAKPSNSNSASNATSRRPQLSGPFELLSGASAGLISQTVSYPLEIIRRRMQVGGVVGDGHKLGIGETARRIWLDRGWRGFFVGLTIGYMKVVPMVAVSFWTYERCKVGLGI
jgi:solute carrier family 25 protein 16